MTYVFLMKTPNATFTKDVDFTEQTLVNTTLLRERNTRQHVRMHRQTCATHTG